MPGTSLSAGDTVTHKTWPLSSRGLLSDWRELCDDVVMHCIGYGTSLRN